MTQDRHLGRRLTAEGVERLFEVPGDEDGPVTLEGPSPTAFSLLNVAPGGSNPEPADLRSVMLVGGGHAV
jgi:hypothetical protein